MGKAFTRYAASSITTITIPIAKMEKKMKITPDASSNSSTRSLGTG